MSREPTARPTPACARLRRGRAARPRTRPHLAALARLQWCHGLRRTERSHRQRPARATGQPDLEDLRASERGHAHHRRQRPRLHVDPPDVHRVQLRPHVRAPVGRPPRRPHRRARAAAAGRLPGDRSGRARGEARGGRLPEAIPQRPEAELRRRRLHHAGRLVSISTPRSSAPMSRSWTRPARRERRRSTSRMRLPEGSAARVSGTSRQGPPVELLSGSFHPNGSGQEKLAAVVAGPACRRQPIAGGGDRDARGPALPLPDAPDQRRGGASTRSRCRLVGAAGWTI